MTDIRSIVAVHFDEHGEISYHVFGGEEVRLFIVDERAPNDRVYEWLPREDKTCFRKLIPVGTDIGSSHDERHGAIEHVINAVQSSKRHLAVVPSDIPA